MERLFLIGIDEGSEMEYRIHLTEKHGLKITNLLELEFEDKMYGVRDMIKLIYHFVRRPQIQVYSYDTTYCDTCSDDVEDPENLISCQSCGNLYCKTCSTKQMYGGFCDRGCRDWLKKLRDKYERNR